MDERPAHRLALQAAGVDAKPPAGRVRVGAQALTVEDQVGERERRRAHAAGTSQSGRSAREISRMSWRSSSIVARPQNQ